MTGTLNIEPSAAGGLMAVLAEYVTASAFAAAGDDVVWTGGGGAMYDVATDPVYTDVKKLTPMAAAECRAAPGCVWKMRRPAAGFATGEPTSSSGGRRTHLALVRIDEPAFVADLDRGVTFTTTFARIRISFVPAAVVDDWMAEVDAVWFYLADSDLDDYHYVELDFEGRFHWPGGDTP